MPQQRLACGSCVLAAQTKGYRSLHSERRMLHLPCGSSNAYSSSFCPGACTVLRLLFMGLTDRHDRVPPEEGHADVSFWYATCVVPFLLQTYAVAALTLSCESRYLVVGIGLLLVRGILIIVHLVVIKTPLISSAPCITTFGSSYYRRWAGMRLLKRL